MQIIHRLLSITFRVHSFTRSKSLPPLVSMIILICKRRTNKFLLNWVRLCFIVLQKKKVLKESEFGFKMSLQSNDEILFIPENRSN